MAEQNSLDAILFSMTVISFLLQLYTIFLIMTKSTAEMSVYRFYLYGIAITDMLFGISLGFLMKPEMWIPDSGALEIKGLAKFFGWEGGRISFSLYVTSFWSQFMFQMFAMLFRYSQVMSMEHPTLSDLVEKRSTRIYIFLFICIISAVIGYFFYTFSYPMEIIMTWQFNGHNDTLLKANVPQNHSEQMEEFLNGDNMKEVLQKIKPYIPRVGDINIFTRALSAEQVRERILYSIRSIEHDETAYKREHKRILEAIKLGHPILYMEVSNRVKMILLGVYFGMLIIVQYLCFYSGISIIRYLAGHRQRFSAQTYKLHLQLTVLLIIQMLQPLFYIILPLLYWLIKLFDIGAERMTFFSNHIYFEIAIIWMASFSVVNPMLTLTFVRPYREYTSNKFLQLIRLLKKLRKWLRNEPNANAIAPFNNNNNNSNQLEPSNTIE